MQLCNRNDNHKRYHGISKESLKDGQRNEDLNDLLINSFTGYNLLINRREDKQYNDVEGSFKGPDNVYHTMEIKEDTVYPKTKRTSIECIKHYWNWDKPSGIYTTPYPAKYIISNGIKGKAFESFVFDTKILRMFDKAKNDYNDDVFIHHHKWIPPEYDPILKHKNDYWPLTKFYLPIDGMLASFEYHFYYNTKLKDWCVDHNGSYHADAKAYLATMELGSEALSLELQKLAETSDKIDKEYFANFI